MLPQNLAHNVEPARQRRIAAEKGLFGPLGPSRADSRDQRLLWVDEFALSLGERRRQRADRGARPLHGRSLSIGGVETDGARFRALGPHAMPDRLLGILGRQAL